MHKTKGTGTTDLVNIGMISKVDRHRLRDTVKRRVIKGNGQADGKAIVRFEQHLLITETGYEETTQELLALTFESIDGRLVVTEMEDLAPEGGI
jgi:hypothetical protein